MSALLAFLGRERKAIVAALVPPGLVLAGHYLGGIPTPHVWYVVVTMLAGALGVHYVPNDPPPASSSTPPAAEPSPDLPAPAAAASTSSSGRPAS